MANFTGGEQNCDAGLGFPVDVVGTQVWTILSLRGFIAGGPVGGSPPIVTFVQPPPGQPIRSPGTTVIIDVQDPQGLAALCMLVEFDSGAYEVIHDGVDFASRYLNESSRQAIANGFRFIIKRAGGWFDNATFRVLAVDPAGGIA